MKTIRHAMGAVLPLTMALLATPAITRAQSVSVPPNLILPNYDRVPVGQQEGIEAGAFLARTGDAGANWFNPAGLAKSVGSAVNASATAYERTTTELEGLGSVAGRSRINSVGTLFSAVLGEGPLHSDRWRLGFSIASPITWKPSSIELTGSGLNGREQLAYATNVDFGVMIPAVAAAYAPGGVASGKFRVGAGMGLAMTSLSQTQVASDRITDSTTTALVSVKNFSAEGSSWDLRFTGGVQWEATPAITLGARLAAPSLRVRGSSRLGLQSTVADGQSLQDVYFQDPEAPFDYKLPGEAALGVAARGGFGEMEVDVHYYGSIAAYDMYTSTVSGTRTAVDPAGVVTVTPAPFATTSNSARSVVNVAVGGSHPLTTKLRVHAGFSSDRSPVPDNTSSIFRQVDLNRITSGVSLKGSSLSGSLGLGYSFGSGTRFSTLTTGGGEPVDTRLKVRTANLLFALSYSFQPK